MIQGKSAATMVAFSLIATATGQADDKKCKRPNLVWETWRDHVIAANRGADYFKLRGDGRDKILRAYNCIHASDKCPPDRLMVFHSTRNKKVLLAFVNRECVTFAEDILNEDYRHFVIGGDLT